MAGRLRRVMEVKAILFKVYYESPGACVARSNVFLAVAYRAHVAFSIGLHRLVLGLSCGIKLFLRLFSRFGFAGLVSVLGYLVLNSACHNVTFFLYGVFGYGSKRK